MQSVKDAADRVTWWGAVPAGRAAGRAGAWPPAWRALDVVGAAGLLVLAGPLLLAAALAIRLDSPGPVLFRQVRLGLGGRPFEMLKLRTMVAGADPALHRRHVERLLRHPRAARSAAAWAKPEQDPRITRVGRALRASCLDELPQLVNVLRGEMSLVGPRPALPYEAELWAEWHRMRLTVPPGITGPWQVAARGRVDFDSMVRLDLDYIARRSVATNLRILLQTPGALLRHRAGGDQ
jgi:lipopolysaccharide/colanic/teichoic acid biosynthesis glycosyltransferase